MSPTIEGWYWANWKHGPAGQWQVVRVEGEGEGIMRVWSCGSEIEDCVGDWNWGPKITIEQASRSVP